MGDAEMKQQFFHGGCRGLEAGDILLPPLKTGVATVCDEQGGPYRRDRVYFSATPAEARDYAALYVPAETEKALRRGEQVGIDDFGGDIYEVEPLGEVEPDPDTDHRGPGYSWQAESAKIVQVVERRVPPDFSALLEDAGLA